ncbi:hypothetical protein HYPSUDRAFT_72584 [Hypholoma sublateritium FD-334 SS-4]|uniref:Uncharacterized protein n=1 Tax=Hypholoma sublateritium (strain FD-334 SS-4) TaxID=945553 RepID=A0A0D2LUB3_HYPSF|nr:hypothetical protein HYPSUDRAFT_72584 [Hypholoma sublateritium FD-334 SS-4]
MTSRHLRSIFESIFDKGRESSQPEQGYNRGLTVYAWVVLTFSSVLRATIETGEFSTVFFSLLAG